MKGVTFPRTVAPSGFCHPGSNRRCRVEDGRRPDRDPVPVGQQIFIPSASMEKRRLADSLKHRNM